MNKLILLFTTLLNLSPIIAKTTFIGGHFIQPKNKTVTIQYYASVLSYIERRTSKLEVPLDLQNNFLIELETDIPIQFNLLNGEAWLFINKYAAPGDSLWFEFNENKIGITGNCEECVGFMFEWENKFLSNPIANKEFNSSFKITNPGEFAAFWNKRRTDQLDFFHGFCKNKSIPDQFKQFMEAEINYSYAVAMLQYSWRNKSAKKVLNDSTYLKFLDQIRIDDPNVLFSGTYLHFMRELPYSIFNTHLDYENMTDPVTQYYARNQMHVRDSIAQKYFTGKTYDLALYQIINDGLKSIESLKGKPYYMNNFNRTDSLLALYKSRFNDDFYFTRLYKKLREINDTNKLASNFTLKDLQGTSVSLSDFKGKVVYLDFWATNCAPCVFEIPYAQKLKEKFKEKDVVFLYVSMDHSLDKLKKFIASKSFDGIHLIDQKGFASDVADMYKINSIPHYFIIDKNGYLVNQDAPRPSTNPEELIEMLLQ